MSHTLIKNDLIPRVQQGRGSSFKYSMPNKLGNPQHYVVSKHWLKNHKLQSYLQSIAEPWLTAWLWVYFLALGMGVKNTILTILSFQNAMNFTNDFLTSNCDVCEKQL